ncbi:MAG: U32 family peptidase [Gordonibacter sp.]|nr:U32 family peptidase [Gordonibacter sp.]
MRGKRLRALNTPELLAPAGGRAQLEAAVLFGADAVYLACDRFGMRQRAENFSLEELPDVVSFAHANDVSVHVTLNTLMDARDLEALPAYCEALAAAGVDAFIVGDLGALRIAQRYAPGVELHASTQANVSNAETACVWHELGASRVVCAREMSVADIALLRAGIPRELEIEAFVHGALCMAVSGRCLLSSVMAGRSANKGHCTQPCRWNYALVEEKRPGEFIPIEEDVRGSYVMSAQDLCMIDHLDDLAAAGVTSFKIEGRNKKAFYAATVVHAYRSVLDGADPASVADDLRAISHRPYSTGFYYGMAQQSSELDGYLKECLHVATVQSCEPVGEGVWCASATCFNRFCEGDRLEVLSPRRAVRTIQVRNLTWLPTPKKATSRPVPVTVEVANRSAATYSFLVEEPLDLGDFLRIRIES